MYSVWMTSSIDMGCIESPMNPKLSPRERAYNDALVRLCTPSPPDGKNVAYMHDTP